jgi:CSLREA domain-containing protein
MRARTAVTILGTLTALLVAAAPAAARDINVTTQADELGQNPQGCSLREAIESANADDAVGGCTAGAGTDIVRVPSGRYQLTRAGVEDDNTNGDLDVTSELHIVNSGVRPAIIDGGGLDRVVEHVSGANLTISGMTITGGGAAGIADGGGILNSTGNLLLFDSTLTGNVAGVGGGGLANYANAAVTNVTISGNQAGDDGGGIYAAGSSFTSLRNVTVAKNRADSDADNDGDGAGFADLTGTFNTYNTVIGDNTDGSPDAGSQNGDCYTGTGFVPRRTLIENPDFTVCLIPIASQDTNLTGDPKLGPLGNNGGPTATHPLLAGSPAIDSGNPPGGPDDCWAFDQRRVRRTLGGRCDMGAYERVLCGGVAVNRIGTNSGDRLVGTNGRDGFLGMGGLDTLFGRRGNDGLCGNNGHDKINGGPGADYLNGAGGRDTLKGGGGRDRLLGKGGRDTCIGGPARDTASGCEIRKTIAR